mmetsp:Transcript_23941/g.43916  ORF Transcript_23941/g.43916 Transcript_23941/m.43916 type:complete len:211 (+) Transcript_23941:39-671(+)
MRKLAFVLACVVWAGHGQQLQNSIEHLKRGQHAASINPLEAADARANPQILKALAMVLLHSHPSPAFRPCRPGLRFALSGPTPTGSWPMGWSRVKHVGHNSLVMSDEDDRETSGKDPGLLQKLEERAKKSRARRDETLKQYGDMLRPLKKTTLRLDLVGDDGYPNQTGYVFLAWCFLTVTIVINIAIRPLVLETQDYLTKTLMPSDPLDF